MLLRDGAKALLSSTIPIYRKMGYTEEEIFGGFDEAAKFLEKSNLSRATRTILLNVIKEIKEENNAK